jgi:hypothetical protein
MVYFEVAVLAIEVPKIAAGRSQTLVGTHAFQPLSGFLLSLTHFRQTIAQRVWGSNNGDDCCEWRRR